ncbi:MAG: hypothetical protein GY941_05385 [Planctomycetes bacterium]|nr:hypothetical protein [Planctomycetota bacterium]
MANRVIEKPETMGALRDELLNVFTDLRNGELDLSQAAELNNTAGKIINSVKIENESLILIKKIPTTKFITGSQ